MINQAQAEAIREQLIYALSIMDEGGKSIPGGSRALWERDWKYLRLAIFTSVDRIDQIREGRVGGTEMETASIVHGELETIGDALADGRPLSELIPILHTNLDTLGMVLDGTWGNSQVEDPGAVARAQSSDMGGRLKEHQEALENAIERIQTMRERLSRLTEQI